MRQRDFIALLGGAAAAWPVGARGQQPAMPVIGFMGSETPEGFAPRIRAFRQGLSEAGYIEGKNVAIVFQWAGGKYQLFPIMADEFVRQNVSVLVAGGTTLAARAAKAATTIIPTVFYIGGDPVSFGLVPSLSRPGGNLTGVSGLSVELLAKRIELLREALPSAKRLGVLTNPSNFVSADGDRIIIRDSARKLGLELPLLQASSEQELDAIFSRVSELGVDGIVVTSDAYFAAQASKLAALALHHRVPVISLYNDFVSAGGLMSYGGNIEEAYRVLGVYTGRLLDGEKPSDLPVQQATKVELIINLKTAKALGLTVPLSLLGRADEVIE